MDIQISETAAEAVRLKFNPSAKDEVTEIKRLTASLVTMLEQIGQRNDKAAIADSIVAIRHVQTDSMWAVFAATKGL
jgi:hypothetical protein